MGFGLWLYGDFSEKSSRKKNEWEITPETSATEKLSTDCLSLVLVLTFHLSSVSLISFMLTYRPYDLLLSNL